MLKAAVDRKHDKHHNKSSFKVFILLVNII